MEELRVQAETMYHEVSNGLDGVVGTKFAFAKQKCRQNETLNLHRPCVPCVNAYLDTMHLLVCMQSKAGTMHMHACRMQLWSACSNCRCQYVKSNNMLIASLTFWQLQIVDFFSDPQTQTSATFSNRSKYGNSNSSEIYARNVGAPERS
jgi:hypothetical protein